MLGYPLGRRLMALHIRAPFLLGCEWWRPFIRRWRPGKHSVFFRRCSMLFFVLHLLFHRRPRPTSFILRLTWSNHLDRLPLIPVHFPLHTISSFAYGVVFLHRRVHGVVKCLVALPGELASYGTSPTRAHVGLEVPLGELVLLGGESFADILPVFGSEVLEGGLFMWFLSVT